MDRMNPLDAEFLYLEDGTTHMTIASCAVFEGPAPPFDDLVRLFASKLPLVPRYRQRVRFVPLDLGRPVWVDDPHFDLAYHVRHTALPPPGDEADLRRLMARLMSQELDRDRPLWEAWVVEGLADGQWAVVSKVHHCMVDGIAGVDLMSVVLDHDREPAPTVADDWRPAPEPSDLRLAADAAPDHATNPRHPSLAAGPALPPPRPHAGGALARHRREADPALANGDAGAGGLQGDPVPLLHPPLLPGGPLRPASPRPPRSTHWPRSSWWSPAVPSPSPGWCSAPWASGEAKAARRWTPPSSPSSSAGTAATIHSRASRRASVRCSASWPKAVRTRASPGGW